MATRALPNETVELVDHVVAYQGRFRSAATSFATASTRAARAPSSKREVFERGQAAAVLPYDPRRDEVVLIRQFRAGAYVAGRHPWTWEIVAGIIEDDESPEDLVRREAVEEASLEIREVIPIHDVIAQPRRLLGSLRDLPRPCRHHQRRRHLRPGVRRREHPGQGPALRRSAHHAGAWRDRQRHRRDRPAVAGAAPRRGARALALMTTLWRDTVRPGKRRVSRASMS